MTTADAARWAQIKALFEGTVDLPPAAREALIAAAALDAQALAELRSLLAHHDEAAGGAVFMAESAAQALAEAPPQAAAAGQRLGAWEIVRPIGAGGMGEVFEARRADGSYEGRAAVKLLKRGMDSAAVLQRFAQERQALARLSHPHIARLLDAGASEEGLPYFVLEFVQGEPIDEAVKPLTLEQRLHLFLQLAGAVAHAHRNLLVHRDLKPGNVLVDQEGQVKLLDFGIAKALDPLEGHEGHTTVSGQRPYTPNYASPEQVRGEPVSTATDIYSLGVLLYQMLTGTRPTGRSAITPAEAARSVLEDEPTRPSRLSPTEAVDPQWLQTRKRLEGDLDNILLKALEKTVERRYASVDALAADVHNFLAGRPVSARPASPGYVLGRFLLRNRLAVAAGSLGVLGLATGLAAALLQGRVALALGALGLAGGLALALVQSRRAALARDLAQGRLTKMRAVLKDVMERHGDAIHYLPGGMALKVDLLQNMIGHLDQLAEQVSGDGTFAGELAVAYARLADAQTNENLVRVGSDEEGERHADKALNLFALGEAAHAANPQYPMWWARCWRAKTLVAQARGEPALALAHLQRAADILEPLSARKPDDVLLLIEAGSLMVIRGQLHCSTGQPSLNQPEPALKAYAMAEDLYDRLRKHPRSGPKDRAVALHQMGTVAGARLVIATALARLDEAVGHGRRAVQLRQQSCAADPHGTAHRTALATEANNLAVTLLLLPGSAAAEEALRVALLARRTLEALLHDDPASLQVARRLVAFALHHGRALARLTRWDEAIAVYTSLCESPLLADMPGGARRRAWALLERAKAQQACQQHALALADALQAETVFGSVLKDSPRDIDGWLLLARTQALLFELGSADGQAVWRQAHADSVARARAVAPLLPAQEQQAQWPQS